MNQSNTDRESVRFLPIGIDVRGRECVVVGGGKIGHRKASTLLRAGASVTVVAPSVAAELEEYVGERRVQWIKDELREEHLAGAFLVVAATNDQAVNSMVTRIGRKYHALVCDASSAERSQVIFGALLDGKDSTIAVFTDGRDPARARAVRDQIARCMSLDNKENG